MGDLWDCIEKAKRQGEEFSAAERQRVEQAMNLRRLESRIDDLQEQIVELNQRVSVLREGPSDAPTKRPFPRYGFTEWLLLYGYQNEDKTWVIEEADVVDWLKRCGLENYI